MFDIKSRTKNVAFTGICTALSVVLLYLASVLPSAKIAVCAVASAVVCLMMVKSGLRGSLSVYFAVSLVSLVMLPDKTVAAAYLLLFGIYPVIKSFIERRNHLVAEWILKIIMFCIYFAIVYFGASLVFSQLADTEYSAWVLFIGVVAVLTVYDVALSLLITELGRRFSGLLS